MEQRENLCCPVLTVTQLQSSLVRHVIVSRHQNLVHMSLTCRYSLSYHLTLAVNLLIARTSIMVKIMDATTILSQPLQCLILLSISHAMTHHHQQLKDQLLLKVLLLTPSIFSLTPGSLYCTISVVAVYDGIGMSNTVSSTVNTTAQGSVRKLTFNIFIST